MIVRLRGAKQDVAVSSAPEDCSIRWRGRQQLLAKR
jgi:hypothetical protein